MRIRFVHRYCSNEKRPLLIFNGLGQSVESLEPVMKALKDTTIIAFDVPGAGRSDVPRLPLRFCQHASVAEALIDHLNYQEVDVFGVSWGGGLAQQFAVQYPFRIGRLILAAAVMGYMMIPGNPRVYSIMSSPRRFTDPGYMQSVAGDIYGGDLRVEPALADKLLQKQFAPSRRGYFYQAMAMYGWTSVPYLWRIKQPTLVIQGRDDPMIPVANARLLATLIPDSRLELMDCGHLFMLTRTEQIVDMLEKFTG
jgi:poly(3-hydroxyalkanoate) depolymerase